MIKIRVYCFLMRLLTWETMMDISNRFNLTTKSRSTKHTSNEYVNST